MAGRALTVAYPTAACRISVRASRRGSAPRGRRGCQSHPRSPCFLEHPGAFRDDSPRAWLVNFSFQVAPTGFAIAPPSFLVLPSSSLTFPSRGPAARLGFAGPPIENASAPFQVSGRAPWNYAPAPWEGVVALQRAGTKSQRAHPAIQGARPDSQRADSATQGAETNFQWAGTHDHRAGTGTQRAKPHFQRAEAARRESPAARQRAETEGGQGALLDRAGIPGPNFAFSTFYRVVPEGGCGAQAADSSKVALKDRATWLDKDWAPGVTKVGIFCLCTD